MNLFDNLIFLEIGWNERFQANDFGHIFVHNLVCADLDAFEGALSKYYQTLPEFIEVCFWV